jgi:hypothetical protein
MIDYDITWPPTRHRHAPEEDCIMSNPMRILLLHILVTTLAVLVVPSAWAQAVQAQEMAGDTTQPGVLYACYVPPTGLVYRIKGPDLSKACLAEDHVAFSWIDASAGGLGQPLVLAASKGGPEGTVQSLNDLMGKLELRGAGGATITTDDEEVITITTPDGTSLSAPEGGPADALVVDNDGSVGIGTTTPVVELEVNGTVGASAFASTSPLILEAPAGTERMRIDDNTGNVGIGTTTPDHTLHVFNPENSGAVFVSKFSSAGGDAQP